MSFSLVQATAKGRVLLAKAQIGAAIINFTHIKMGDGQMTGQVIDEMQDLINIKKELDITGLKVLPEGKAKVQAAFTNKDLSTGFYWREVGVFATDPDNPGAEIMYCYGNAGALADYIPAGSGSQILETILSILTIVSNAANVTAAIDESNIYLTSQDAEQTYIKKSLATATSQFLVSSAAGQFVIKTVAEIKSLLGLGSAAYTDSSSYATSTQGTKADNAATQTDFNAHLADYIRQPAYATASGSANAYTVTLNPAMTNYAEGAAIAVKINVTNTGASTVNINNLGAKTIKDSKGNSLTAGKLTANSIYTLRYNGTNFILQGEGGEYGTATANSVLSGVTFGTENGLIAGAIPIKLSQTYNPSITAQTIASGQYLYGEQTINPVIGTATAADVANGKTFCSANGINLTGTNTNKRWASGTATTNPVGSGSPGYMVISGLAFTPTLVIAECTSINSVYARIVVYSLTIKSGFNTNAMIFDGAYKAYAGAGNITANGFYVVFYDQYADDFAGQTVTWRAYE